MGKIRFSQSTDSLSGTATREILKHTASKNVISFAGGMPATSCLPAQQIAQVTNEILSSSDSIKVLQYGVTDGMASLKEAAIPYLKWYGNIDNLELSNLLVISGGQQALDLTCKALLNKGDTVLVEAPTYLAFLQIALSYQANVIGVRSGPDGIDTDDLEEKIKKYNPKLLYVVPNFSNPTGKTYPLDKRKKIAEITDKYGVVVLEDDPYGKLRFTGEEIPSIKSVGGDNILFVTSFSKLISPGIRVGLAAGDSALIRRMEICKQGADVHTSNLSQAIVKEFLVRNLLPDHIKKITPVYKHNKELMETAIIKYMPEEFDFTRVEGGMFIWGEFASPLNTHEIFYEIIEKGVAYVYGNAFYPDGSGLNTMRLNFSNATEENIDKGIKILGDSFKEKIAKLKK